MMDLTSAETMTQWFSCVFFNDQFINNFLLKKQNKTTNRKWTARQAGLSQRLVATENSTVTSFW